MTDALKPCGCDEYVPYIAGLDRGHTYCQKCGAKPEITAFEIKKKQKYSIYDLATEKFHSIRGEQGLRNNEHAFVKKVCGCDNSVPYYPSLGGIRQMVECSGCGKKVDFEFLVDWINYVSKGSLPGFSYIEEPGES